MIETQVPPLPSGQRQTSGGEVVLGLLPMLLWPAFSALSPLLGPIIQRSYAGGNEAVSGLISGWIFLLLVSVAIIALLVAGMQGWPRWAFPYLGVLVGLSLVLAHSSTPGLRLFGHTFGRNDLWGWRAWIPELVWLGLCLALTRSLRPVVQLFKMPIQDWTRLTFGIYSLLPPALFVLFDEMHGEEFFVALLGLLLAAGGAGYLRAADTSRRFFWMAGATTLVWMAAAIYLGLYWNGRQEPWMSAPAVGWSTFIGTLISTGAVLVVLGLPGVAGAIAGAVLRLFRETT